MTLLENTFLPKAVIGFDENPDYNLEAMWTGKDGSSGGNKSFCEASALYEGFSWPSGELETLSSCKGWGERATSTMTEGSGNLGVQDLKYTPSQVREPHSLTRVQIFSTEGL